MSQNIQIQQIQFRDIEHLDHLDAFVVDQMEKMVERFNRDARPFEGRAIISKEVGGTEPFGSIFCCEIILAHPAFRGHPVFAKKTSPDFHQAVRDACHTVEKTLRKFSDLKHDRRRRVDVETTPVAGV